VIASYDPRRPPTIEFFYDMRLPIQRFAESNNNALRIAATIIEPLSRVFSATIPSQCNEFAFAISKNGEPHLWITESE